MGQPTTGTTASSNVYYVNGRWVYVGIGFFVGAAGIFLMWLLVARFSRIGITLESDLSPFMAVLSALAFSALFIASGLRDRLVVSPEKIEYRHSGFFSMISPWSNVERIADLKVGWGGPVQPWLVLKDLRAISGRKNPVMLFWMRDLRGRIIPLGAMWAHQEDLLADVRRYIPLVDRD